MDSINKLGGLIVQYINDNNHKTKALKFMQLRKLENSLNTSSDSLVSESVNNLYTHLNTYRLHNYKDINTLLLDINREVESFNITQTYYKVA